MLIKGLGDRLTMMNFHQLMNFYNVTLHQLGDICGKFHKYFKIFSLKQKQLQYKCVVKSIICGWTNLAEISLVCSNSSFEEWGTNWSLSKSIPIGGGKVDYCFAPILVCPKMESCLDPLTSPLNSECPRDILQSLHPPPTSITTFFFNPNQAVLSLHCYS